MRKILSYTFMLFYLATGLLGCSKEDTEIIYDKEGQGPIRGGDYYVAPWGNDDSAGTFEQPWATWQKAFETARAGDTVYIRGGIWYPDRAQQDLFRNSATTIAPKNSPPVGYDGTYDNPVCFLNYPGENPVLDCSDMRPIDNYLTGITILQADFIHFRGLTVRNVHQTRDYVECFGITASYCSNLKFEAMTVYDIDGNAFRYVGAIGHYGIVYDSTYFINCDAYNNCDSRPRTAQGDPALGGAADGFKAWNEPGGAFIEFRGCRAWNNSDDGFDPSADATTVLSHCWSFNNGGLDGDGTGFKTGGIYNDYGDDVKRIVNNCIAAFNRDKGFFLLEYPDYYRTNARFYNNTSYANLYGFSFSRNENRPQVLGVWINNIAYKNIELPFNNSYQVYAESNNTWDLVEGYPGYINSVEVTVSDDDFISLNAEELKGPRKDDGSLPDINFLKPVMGSDLINAGVDVGLPFLGIAPDIGAIESE